MQERLGETERDRKREDRGERQTDREREKLF
jgi:hypothetical protein